MGFDRADVITRDRVIALGPARMLSGPGPLGKLGKLVVFGTLVLEVILSLRKPVAFEYPSVFSPFRDGADVMEDDDVAV